MHFEVSKPVWIYRKRRNKNRRSLDRHQTIQSYFLVPLAACLDELIRKNVSKHGPKGIPQFQDLVNLRFHRLTGSTAKMILLLRTSLSFSGNGIKVVLLRVLI